jgi:hypothetical protein
VPGLSERAWDAVCDSCRELPVVAFCPDCDHRPLSFDDRALVAEWEAGNRCWPEERSVMGAYCADCRVAVSA